MAEAVQRALRDFFSSHPGVSKADFARTHGLNRVMLHRYLKGQAVPSAESLRRLVSAEGIEIVLGGKVLTIADLPRSRGPAGRSGASDSRQLSLPLGQPLAVVITDGRESAEETLSLQINRIGPQLQVTIKVRTPEGDARLAFGE